MENGKMGNGKWETFITEGQSQKGTSPENFIIFN